MHRAQFSDGGILLAQHGEHFRFSDSDRGNIERVTIAGYDPHRLGDRRVRFVFISARSVNESEMMKRVGHIRKFVRSLLGRGERLGEKLACACGVPPPGFKPCHAINGAKHDTPATGRAG